MATVVAFERRAMLMKEIVDEAAFRESAQDEVMRERYVHQRRLVRSANALPVIVSGRSTIPRRPSQLFYSRDGSTKTAIRTARPYMHRLKSGGSKSAKGWTILLMQAGRYCSCRSHADTLYCDLSISSPRFRRDVENSDSCAPPS